jgi:hypothetical protein
MSQLGNPPSPGEVSPSVALLAACAPDHHQPLHLSHFPDCEICLAARDYFINKETTKKHHVARFLASNVSAPELPLGYAPTGLRTYRRPRVPGTPDPVQLLLPGRTQPVLPSHTPSPKGSPVPYAPTPLKRKRSLSFQEELQLEREAEKEDNERCPLGQPEHLRFATQGTPVCQVRSIRQATPSRPDDETRGTSSQICHQHHFDNPEFVPSPYHDPSIWDSAPTAPQLTTTSLVSSSPLLSSSIHRTQPGAISDLSAQDLELVHPFGAQGIYVYGLKPPEHIRDPPHSPPPFRGMQFASRICGTAASIGSGAINFVSNAVNTLLGRPAPRHVPVDNAGQVVLPDQPVIQAPKRRRVDGSREPLLVTETRRRSGSPSAREDTLSTQNRRRDRSLPPRREHGTSTSSSHSFARRAATASPTRQNGGSSAAAQFLRNVKAAKPRLDSNDRMDVDEPSAVDIKRPSIDESDLMDIDESTNHIATTTTHEQAVQQSTTQLPTVGHKQSILDQSIIQEIAVQQHAADETAIEQSSIEQPTVKQPIIEQPALEQQHRHTEQHAVQLNKAITEESAREQQQPLALSNEEDPTKLPEQELSRIPETTPDINAIFRFNPIHPDFVGDGLSEDDDSEDEGGSSRRPIREQLLRRPGLMRVKPFLSPQERLRQKKRRAEKEKRRLKTSLQFGPARTASRAPRYQNITDFFDNDDSIHITDGFHKDHPPLVPNRAKVAELEELYWARVRKEEADRLNAKLKAEEERREAERRAEEKRREAARKVEEERRAAEREKLRREQSLWDKQLEVLGLRKPNATMITPISQEWNRKVEDALAGRSGKVKTPGPEALELIARDFDRLVPETAWLNDSCVTAALTLAAKYVNDRAGIIIKKGAPKCVTLNTYFWSQLCSSGPGGKARMLSRVWGLTPENFLGVETIVVPVNLHSHWSFVIVRPSRREIAYVDSFQSKHEDRVAKMHEFLKVFLDTRYNADEWKTVYFKVPVQTNTWDCGVFTITNTMYLVMGIDPSGYGQEDMPLQRRRIAAAILNGGFTGDFDLSQL